VAEGEECAGEGEIFTTAVAAEAEEGIPTTVAGDSEEGEVT